MISDYRLGTIVRTQFVTTPDGVTPTAMSGAVLKVWKDNDAASEHTFGESSGPAHFCAIAEGFDGQTGRHAISLVTSDEGSGFWASGHYYTVAFTAGTCGGKALAGFVVLEFTIEMSPGLMGVYEGRKLLVDSDGLGNVDVIEFAGASQTGSVDVANQVGGMTGNLYLTANAALASFAILSDSVVGNAGLDDTLTLIKTATGRIPMSPASTTNITMASGVTLTSLYNAAKSAASQASVDALVAPDNSTIGNIYTRIGAGGAGLTALGDTRLVNLDATVSSRASQTSVNAIPTTAASLSNEQVAAIAAEVAAALGGGGQGSGADHCTMTIKRTGGAAIADAQVWISSDAAGETVVAGYLTTNSQGKVTFLLDAGTTYYLWMQKDGENPIEGAAFVAVAD